MQFTSFLRSLWQQQSRGLVFGRRNLTNDERMLFWADCAAANPKGFGTEWGGRFVGYAGTKRKTDAQKKERFCNVSAAIDEDGVEKLRGVVGKMIGGKPRLFRP